MKRTLTIAGICVNRDDRFKGTVVIDTLTGLIMSLQPFNLSADIVLEDSCFISPGLIDNHVHGREDETGEECYKEDFTTLGEAAIEGGVVHMAEMGNNPKPPTDDLSYRGKEKLTSKSRVPVTLYAMIGPKTNPLGFKVAYKLCHARTTGKNDLIFFPSRAEIEAAAARYNGLNVSHHLEDPVIIAENANQLLHESRRPPIAEVSEIDFGLYITEMYNLKSKFCHCSVCTGIRKIVAAKKRGVQVTCEVTPGHLYFDLSMVTDENRPWMQLNPPLRSREDRLFCIEALLKGRIDMIATDHAPHTAEDKLKGSSGLPQLDTLGAFITWLIYNHGFRPEDVVRVCSYNPSLFLNEFLPESYGKGYGRIDTGYMGSLTVIDMGTPTVVTKGMLKTKCAWSPFEGITFPGSVRHTIVKGVVLK